MPVLQMAWHSHTQHPFHRQQRTLNRQGRSYLLQGTSTASGSASLVRLSSMETSQYLRIWSQARCSMRELSRSSQGSLMLTRSWLLVRHSSPMLLMSRFSTLSTKKTSLPRLVWCATDLLIRLFMDSARVEDTPNPKKLQATWHRQYFSCSLRNSTIVSSLLRKCAISRMMSAQICLEGSFMALQNRGYRASLCCSRLILRFSPSILWNQSSRWLYWYPCWAFRSSRALTMALWSSVRMVWGTRPPMHSKKKAKRRLKLSVVSVAMVHMAKRVMRVFSSCPTKKPTPMCRACPFFFFSSLQVMSKQSRSPQRSQFRFMESLQSRSRPLSASLRKVTLRWLSFSSSWSSLSKRQNSLLFRYLACCRLRLNWFFTFSSWCSMLSSAGKSIRYCLISWVFAFFGVSRSLWLCRFTNFSRHNTPRFLRYSRNESQDLREQLNMQEVQLSLMTVFLSYSSPSKNPMAKACLIRQLLISSGLLKLIFRIQSLGNTVSNFSGYFRQLGMSVLSSSHFASHCISITHGVNCGWRAIVKMDDR